MQLTDRQLKKLVLDRVSLCDVLNRLDNGEHYRPNTTCFCPFHNNTNTPSASIYSDEEKETLFCFSEKRLYTVVDALEILFKKDIYDVADKIWSRMSESEKQRWLADNQEVDYKVMFEDEDQNTTPYNITKDKFRSGKIELSDVLNHFLGKS